MPNIQDGNQLITVDVFAKAGVTEGMVIGDLGCGNLGYFSVAGAKVIGKSGLIYAVDILKSVLQAVNNIIKQKNLENIKTIWSNLEVVGAAKISSNTLDVAFIHNVLFQSKKQDLIIQEATRLLKPGGRLVVIDWLKISAPLGPPLNDRVDPEIVKKYAAAAGLKLVEEFSAGPYHFGLLFSK